MGFCGPNFTLVTDILLDVLGSEIRFFMEDSCIFSKRCVCYIVINFRDEIFIPSAIAVLAMSSLSPDFFVTWTAHTDDLERGLCCNRHYYALGLCFDAVYNDKCHLRLLLEVKAYNEGFFLKMEVLG